MSKYDYQTVVMQKIIVKNFRQISYAEVEIKKVLFLIGEQASGKSTLAKLIYFFKSLKEDYRGIFDEKLNITENSLKENLDKILENKFKTYFGYASELDNDFEITFYYHFDAENAGENRYLKLKKHQVEFNKMYWVQIWDCTKICFEIIIQYVTNYASHLLNDKLNEQVGALFYDKNTPAFFPAGRNITVSFPQQFKSHFSKDISHLLNSPNTIDLHLMDKFIDYTYFLKDYYEGKSFDLIIDNQTKKKNILTFIKEKSEYILKGKYTNVDGSEKILYGKNSKNVGLNLASSGQQEVIRIIQDIFYIVNENQPSFRVIEEPEAHLYPKAQKILMELLVLMVHATDSQLIITTHSPYILSIFNNLLMYSKLLKGEQQHLTLVNAHFETQNLDGKEERIYLFPDEFQGYAMSLENEVFCHSLLDAETGLIGDNFLDEITEDLNNDFDVLYRLNTIRL